VGEIELTKAQDRQDLGPSAQTGSQGPPGVPTDGAAGVEQTPPPPGAAKTFTRNAVLSVGRLFASTVVALLLPAYLSHKLPVTTYSAWVLILQMSAYVGYLDFGIQQGISKFVAEFEARKDSAGSSMRASAGLALMLCASILGVLLTLVLAWYVPSIFHQMPPSLYRDVRLSLVFVGVSLSFGLVCSAFASVFLGQQRYAVPMVLSLLNRILFAAVVLTAVYFQSGLAVMGALVATVNIATGLLQIEAWRRFANRVRFSLRSLDFSVVGKMLSYCSTLAIWSSAMLCITGLDVTIVGRYDFGKTAFYSIATLPTNFAISIMGAALAPLLPAASALSVHRSPLEMGNLLSRMTRYSSVLLIASGLPLLVAGYWLLRLWVGQTYALHTLPYLRILILGNILRNLCMPYASMLVATDSQRVAISGACMEGTVNLASSVYLARHIGALGVAYGTLIGSFVSVGMHFALSMHYTYAKFAVSRARLFLTGLARPALSTIPSLLLVRRWWVPGAPALTPLLWAVWGLSTLLLMWYACFDPGERDSFLRFARARLKLPVN
jgi:O-antigen/teichoic acid export membrane protein